MRSRALGIAGSLLLGLAACGDDTDGAGGGGGSGGGAPDPMWTATLEDVEAVRVALDIPGVAVAVVIDGELAYSGGLGVRARSTGEPVTGETLFRSSSGASKTLVAATLLDLAEEGLVDLDAPLTSVVPSVELDPAYADEITLGLLLSNWSGLEYADFRSSCDDPSATAYFEERGQLASHAPPGAIWEYSALGSVAGAAAIEEATGQAFSDVVTARMIDGMGMTSATYDASAAAEAEHAVGHPRGEIEVEIDASRDGNVACGDYQASAGFLASAADHGRFLQMLLGQGPLEPASLDRLLASRANPGLGSGWGYGLYAYTIDYKGVKVALHQGTNDGYYGGVTWIPERGFGVVTLANFTPSLAAFYDLDDLRYRIADRFLGLTGDPPDYTTDPSTWDVYAGTYVDPSAPTREFDFQHSASGLTVFVDPSFPDGLELAQGSLDTPYQGGDVFRAANGEEFIVAFYPDDGGTMHYAVIYSAAGRFVAQRVD